MNRATRPALVPVAPAPSVGRLLPWQEEMAKQLMLEHLDCGIAVADLAEACALSRSHFTRKFKESTCMPPHVWLRQQRVERAKALLQAAEQTLTDIAMDCGFFDQAHFCRVFAKQVGLSPQGWQRSEVASTRLSQTARKRA